MRGEVTSGTGGRLDTSVAWGLAGAGGTTFAIGCVGRGVLAPGAGANR